MSPQRLRGWEPAETHRLVYDDHDRLVEVHTTRESEWTPDQVALALGVEAYDNSLGKHGQPWDEAISPESDPSNINGKRIYKAGVRVTTPEGAMVWAPLVDHAQRAIEDAQEAFKANATEGTNFNGLVWPVEAVDRSSFAG